MKANTALALDRENHQFDHWDEEAIQQRGVSLFETARLIWSAPQPAEIPGVGVVTTANWSTDTDVICGTDHVRAFWQRYIELDPATKADGAVGGAVRWRAVPDVRIVISRFVNRGERTGIFIRGPRGRDYEEEAQRLEPFGQKLEALLGVHAGSARYLYLKDGPMITENPSSWDQAAEWLIAETDRYVNAVTKIFS